MKTQSSFSVSDENAIHTTPGSYSPQRRGCDLFSPQVTVDTTFWNPHSQDMPSVAQTMTAQQLFEMPGHEHFDLVEGELVPMSPQGFDHGCIVGESDAAL